MDIKFFLSYNYFMGYFFYPFWELLKFLLLSRSHIFRAVMPGHPSTINMDMSLAWEKNLTPGEVMDDALLEVCSYAAILCTSKFALGFRIVSVNFMNACETEKIKLTMDSRYNCILVGLLDPAGGLS
jgi:hypothetical protein